MCFDTDARPPLPPIRGGALDARDLTLTSRDGTAFAAHAARAERPSGAGIVIIPDVRGLAPYYEELTLRFAEAGVHAVAIDFYARTAGAEKRAEGFEYEPHVRQLDPTAINDDVAAAVSFLRSPEGGAPERIYTVGFCIGGRISLLQAANGLDLRGVIGLYPWPTGPHRTNLTHRFCAQNAAPRAQQHGSEESRAHGVDDQPMAGQPRVDARPFSASPDTLAILRRGVAVATT